MLPASTCVWCFRSEDTQAFLSEITVNHEKEKENERKKEKRKKKKEKRKKNKEK